MTDELTAATSIELVLEAKPREVGTMTVARVLPALHRRRVGPIVFLDHMGPVTLPPGVGFDVAPHPHIGLSTVTYFFAGENVHRDSLGTVVTNRPGDVNVMTAGRGVVHSERAPAELRARGGAMHGLQIWVGLPTSHEDAAPSFEHHPAATLPALAPAAGVTGRLLIGAAFGARSPIAHPSAPLLVDLELAAGAVLSLPAAPGEPGELERALFVVSGELAVGAQALAAEQLAVLTPAAASVRALAPARLLLLGGPPLGERFLDWNFVASSKERLAAARAAWQAEDRARFPLIPGDAEERVPYPTRFGRESRS